MKLFADYEISPGCYKNISFWFILNNYKEYLNQGNDIDFRQYYRKFFKNRLFSTHKNIERKKEMVFVKGSVRRKSHFRYLKADNHKGNSESVNHSIFKEIFSELEVLNLFIFGEIVKIYVSNSDIEYSFKANGNQYIADVYVEFEKSEPMEYFYRWGGKICVEIKYTHAVDEKKINDCFIEGIPVYEYTINDTLKIDEHIFSEEALLAQKKYIFSRLSKIIFGKLVVDYKSEEYIMIENLKKENHKLKVEYSKLKEFNTQLENERNQRELYINKLQYENAALQHYKMTIENNPLLKFFIKRIIR